MKGFFVAFVLLFLAQPVGAQEPVTADTLLEHMPCRAWIIMHDNNWSGQNRDQIEVETWTVKYLREYARRAVERLKKDEPGKDWRRGEGADVDDSQILDWIVAYCTKNPRDPLIEAAFFLHTIFVIVPDHRQLLPP